MTTGGVSDTERGTDESFDFLCSVCKSKNKNTEADKFCSDCHDYYCSICVKFHDEIPALKSHKIVDKAQFQPGSSVKFPEVPTERCKIHAQKPLDMYCKQHDVVGCSKCMVVDHGKCSDRLYVPEYVVNNANVTKSRDVTAKLDKIANLLKSLEKKLTKEKETLANSKERCLKKIQKFREEINIWLDDLERNTVNELEKRFRSLINKNEDELKRMQALKQDVESAKNRLSSAGGNMSQMFVSIKMANAIATQAKQTADANENQISSKEISFSADQKIQFLFNEVRSLGSISQIEEPQLRTQTHISDTIPRITPTRADQVTFQSQQTPSLLQVKEKKQYPVKVKSDKTTCSIYSACTLPDGSIILADHANSNLKRLDCFTYTITGCCDVPERPWQVCAISKHEAAVSCNLSKLVQFVSLGQIMQKTRKINTGTFCHSLAHCDGKLFVSDLKSVYVYTVSGEKLQQFYKDQAGLELFSSIYSLVLSNDSSNIYVTDIKRGLIILDRHGQLLGQYNGPELIGTRGVCLYKSDSVLVCCYLSKNVLQFSTDGKRVGEVMKTDAHCRAVCCIKNNSELLICLDTANEILVTKL